MRLYQNARCANPLMKDSRDTGTACTRYALEVVRKSRGYFSPDIVGRESDDLSGCILSRVGYSQFLKFIECCQGVYFGKEMLKKEGIRLVILNRHIIDIIIVWSQQSPKPSSLILRSDF
jgi:hypothetical protein